MCIAIVKPAGKSLPQKKTLEICWNNNKDGAGFMYNTGREVIGEKGFMTFDAFYKRLKELDKKIGFKDRDVVLHFRIATHGGINQDCTHPFPVTTNIEEMRAHTFVAQAGFAHNGIITGYGNNVQKVSDTMDYCASVIANIKHLEEQDTLINTLAYSELSRFAVLLKNKYIIGGAWKEADGIYYSNDSYKEVKRYVYVKPATGFKNYQHYGSLYKNVPATIDDYAYANMKGKCDICGSYEKLYSDGEMYLCADCKRLETAYTK